MIIQGQVGPQATTSSLATAAQPNLRLGNMGDLIASQLHGRFYEAAYRRVLYTASNQAGTTTSAGLSTTYTGLVLCNPVGTPVNLVVRAVGLSFGVAFAAAAGVGILTGYNSSTNVTHTTPLTPRSQFIGATYAGYGLADSSATLPTAPVVNTILMVGVTGAITTVPSIPAQFFDIDGAIILPPGAYAGVYTSTASGASSMIASIMWEEVPA